jgi:hypothetical protein
MFEEKTVIKLDRYEVGAVLTSLIGERNDLLHEKKSTETIDNVILKIDRAKTERVKERERDEAR